MTNGSGILRFFLYLLLLFASACGLKYQPVKTPRDLIKDRQEAIIEQLKQDFSARSLVYKAIKFGQSTTVKPPSFYKLDSLYQEKYELEKKQLISKTLEDQIALQLNVVNQDTSPVYFIEKHVFSVDEGARFEVFLADISVSKKNVILTLDILESNAVDKQLTDFYASMAFKESFIYPDTYPDESELAFYEFYQEKLDQLEGEEKAQFLNFVLRVMQIAQRGKNVDKSYLIKELVRTYVQGNTRNYLDERFNDMDEFYNEKNEISYYKVNYTYSIKDDLGTYRPKKCNVLLDEYLQLLEIIPLDK